MTTKAKLPTVGTLPDQILTMTALCGELPNRELSRFHAAPSYIERTVKRLRHDNLLQTHYRDGLRGLRLTQTARKLLLDQRPDRFSAILGSSHEHSQLKSEPDRRRRTHRMAEVLMTMHHAGVRAFPWEKPALFQPTPMDHEPSIWPPLYYSSHEIKDVGLLSTKIFGSRMMGILLSPEQQFLIYNIGEGEIRWGQNIEMRLKAFCLVELQQRRLPSQFGVPISAIVFASSMQQMEWLMQGGREARSYFVLEQNFDHFYFLTNDCRGEIILQVLYDPDRKAYLDDILMEDLTTDGACWGVDCDAFDADGALVLFGYTCDMPHIKRFDNGLSLHDLKGTLICFDFQEEVMRAVCGPNVTLQLIDFDAYESQVFHQE